MVVKNHFEVVNRKGYFQRLSESFAGIVVGFVLVVGAFPLLWWNESRSVQAERALGEAQHLVVSVSPEMPAPTNSGKLVHLTGTTNAPSPIHDNDLDVGFNNALVVSRKVEMYQWIETESSRTTDQTGGTQETKTTYDYKLGWSEEWQDSSKFKFPEGHGNPQATYKSETWTARDAKLGGFDLNQEALSKLSADQAIAPEAEPDGWQKHASHFYLSSDPTDPVIGDYRVSYHALQAPTKLSVMAQQTDTGFATFEMRNGYSLFLVAQGELSAEKMISDQKAMESALTWALRLAGIFAMWSGFCLVMGPLKALANFLPFLANVAGTAVGLVGFALTLPLSLGTIGLAWLFYRPFVGIMILLSGAGAGYVLLRYKNRLSPNANAHSPSATHAVAD